MKALVITSNKPRHIEFTCEIAKYFELCGIISQPKSNYYNRDHQAKNQQIVEHLNNLQEYEKRYFQIHDFPISPRIVDANDLNNDENIQWAKNLSPDIIFLFGTGILAPQWLENFDKKIINLHLGLSPYYRGSATLFWPFFDDNLCCLGATIHLASEKVDSGDILHRVKADFYNDDNYYTITNRLIKKSIKQAPKAALKYIKGELKPIKQELNLLIRESKKKDFTEQALIEVLDRTKNGYSNQDIAKIYDSNKCAI